jgi:hypothetical protein
MAVIVIERQSAPWTGGSMALAAAFGFGGAFMGLCQWAAKRAMGVRVIGTQRGRAERYWVTK